MPPLEEQLHDAHLVVSVQQQITAAADALDEGAVCGVTRGHDPAAGIDDLGGGASPPGAAGTALRPME